MPQQQRTSRWRVWHRWLSVIFGVQMVIWSISGAYMVFFDLDFIHGDHLVQDITTVVPPDTNVQPVSAVIEKYPHSQTVTLDTRWINQQLHPVYVAKGHHGTKLLDATSLEPIQLSETDIIELANRYYAKGEAEVGSVVYLTENPPTELNPKLLPIWQVNYDDFGNTSLYLSPETGEMLVKRHTFWRGFDFFWMTHIMDYEDRTDIESWWLQGFMIGTFILMITGAVLLVYTISFRRKRPGGAQ